ncbi:hypothetical protein [Saccharothrix longispora]|uniref:hypothetical protein n=1 Tax=Saccharothrix longispora TaxID=33920 RepID=UPI0028FD37CF|nr:hypothetical protein [Saccharothrix longispora]MBY8851429.1 hypothetical protein [Saccharothrix sp. MB29]MDU0290657.1 hypothetical protein [Saccharothrix longispora]
MIIAIGEPGRAGPRRVPPTAVKIFTDDPDGARMQTVDFDELARARRCRGTDPAPGPALLDDITRRWDR